MGWLRTARLVVLACALAVPAAMASASAAQGSAQVARASDATLSVLHAIPVGVGADVVDVYAGRSLVVDNLTPGRLVAIKVAGGTYDLAVFPDGKSPGSSAPLLSAPRTKVSAGANLTVTANLTAAGNPTLNVYANDTTTVGNGMGRLTVRHIAAAPAVDVRTSGSVLLAGLRNPKQASAGLDAGVYLIDVVLTGTRKVVLGATSVTIRNRPGTDDMGTNTIIYIWGSAADGSLSRAVQEVRIDLR